MPLKIAGSHEGSLTLTLHAMEGTGQYSATSQPSSTVLATLSGTAPTSSTWTDTTYTCSGSGCNLSAGKTYFVVAASSNSNIYPAYAWAYASTETETALPSGNGWSVGHSHYQQANRVWESYSDWNIAEIAFATNPSLDASNVTATGATLTVGGYSGAWWYKHTNTGATCDGPVAAGTSTKALANLTAGTSYTFSAYSDSTCTSGNLLATAAQFTAVSPTLTASNVAATTATLTIANHSGAWYYKHTNTGATCDGPVATGTSTKALTNLTAGTSYTYSAYSDSTCTTGNLLATAAQFTTAVTVSNLSQSFAGNTGVSNGNGKIYANQFRTGGNSGDYTLSEVTVDIGGKSGSIGALQVEVWSDSSGNPGSKAPGVTLTANDSTATSGQLAYTCSGSCTLSANTDYWVRLSASGSGQWSWNYTSSGSETKVGNTDWEIGDNKVLILVNLNHWGAANGYFKMKVEAIPNPSLDASSVTATGATLTLSHHLGAWYYKHTNTGATCDGPVAAGTSTKALTTLTANTSYTYSAYSDSTCTTGNLLATAAQFTTLHSPPGTPTNLRVNKNSWRADWDAPANKGSGGNAITYTLECKKSGSGWVTEASGSSNNYEAYLNQNECRHFTTYLRVKAVNTASGLSSGWHELDLY